MLKCCYREHCTEEGCIVLGKEKKAPVQSRDQSTFGHEGEGDGIAGELEREGRLDIALQEKRLVPNFCCSFAEFAVQLMRRNERHEVQKLINVMFDAFFDAKKLRRHARRVQDCKRVGTERPHNALSRERFWREKRRE